MEELGDSIEEPSCFIFEAVFLDTEAALGVCGRGGGCMGRFCGRDGPRACEAMDVLAVAEAVRDVLALPNGAGRLEALEPPPWAPCASSSAR